jgi:uncharacterized protein YyaL (SSP411 family)
MLLHSLSVFLLFVFLLQPAGAATSSVLSNQLDSHASPYLAMHGDDPVAWQDWQPKLLKQTQNNNQLLFISSGYFSCHWCHVMQRESYKSEDVAELLNKHFIPVKIDRELEPALDAHLIEFVELTRGHAGWPLNVILTPEGYPLIGFTYLPKQRFYDLLKEVSKRWQQEPDRLAELARQGTQEIIRTKLDVMQQKVGASVDPVEAFTTSSLEMADDMSGGFGRQSKFPMTIQLQQLVNLVGHKKEHVLAPFVRLTLDQMVNLGLHDHIGGGFFRYSTDPDWTLPHFEKMLYDNAQLALLYLNAGELLDDTRYLETGFSTLDFILENMAGSSGGYVGSFSAVDDQGREGFYYSWTLDQLKQILNPDELKFATAYWSLQGNAVTEFGYLPTIKSEVPELANSLNVKPDSLKRHIESAREKLIKLRKKRSLPVDDKQLAAWNGLFLSALARASQLTDDKKYTSAGSRLANYLVKHLWDGKQLLRATGKTGVMGQASVKDYALVAKGLRDWSLIESDKSYAQLSDQLTKIAWKKYFHGKRWYQSDESTLPGLGGSLAFTDSALPSASAVLSNLALTGKSLKKDRQLQKNVLAHLQQVRKLLGADLFWYAGYVDLLD